MTVPVPFGQYFPGASPVHRLDARAKLGVVFAGTLVLFATESWAAIVAVAIVTLLAAASSRVPWKVAARGLRPVAYILVFTIAANALRWRPDEALLRLGPVAIVGPGLWRGLYFGGRILVLVMGTSLVSLTTSPVALTDALASLMRPLRLVRVPVDDIATMLSIALRFVPTTAEEAERILVAQTARGAVFDKGGPVKRARAWIPVLVPLFVRLFRRADDLAIAMETRCYTGVGRTRLREPKMVGSDWATLAVAVTLAMIAVILW